VVTVTQVRDDGVFQQPDSDMSVVKGKRPAKSTMGVWCSAAGEGAQATLKMWRKAKL